MTVSSAGRRLALWEMSGRFFWLQQRWLQVGVGGAPRADHQEGP